MQYSITILNCQFWFLGDYETVILPNNSHKLVCFPGKSNPWSRSWNAPLLELRLLLFLAETDTKNFIKSLLLRYFPVTTVKLLWNSLYCKECYIIKGELTWPDSLYILHTHSVFPVQWQTLQVLLIFSFILDTWYIVLTGAFSQSESKLQQRRTDSDLTDHRWSLTASFVMSRLSLLHSFTM